MDISGKPTQSRRITFLKRAIHITIVAELVLTAPVIICLFRCTKFPDPLRLWSMLRVLLFVVQTHFSLTSCTSWAS